MAVYVIVFALVLFMAFVLSLLSCIFATMRQIERHVRHVDHFLETAGVDYIKYQKR